MLGELAGNMNGKISNANMPADLDMWVILSENAQGGKPSTSYCKQYAASHNVDPERLLLDWSDSGVSIPIQDPPGQYSVTANATAVTHQNIDPYLSVTWICSQSQGSCQSDADCNGGSDFCGIIETFSPWHAVLRGTNFEYIWSSYYDDTVWAGDKVNQLM